jgi:hypothetical protein
MVTNWRPRYPLWQGIINYFNECFNEGRTPTRKHMLGKLREKGFNVSGSINSIDSYRNYLFKAGYIGTIRRGRYSIDDLIPSDLSVDDCRSQAYGGLTPIRIARAVPTRPVEFDFRHIEQEFHSASSSSISSSSSSSSKNPEIEFLTQEDMEI